MFACPPQAELAGGTRTPEFHAGAEEDEAEAAPEDDWGEEDSEAAEEEDDEEGAEVSGESKSKAEDSRLVCAICKRTPKQVFNFVKIFICLLCWQDARVQV